jgi:hypothetical protein
MTASAEGLDGPPSGARRVAGPGAASPLDDVVMGARFAWRLPIHLRRRLTVAEARATVQDRLRRREQDFLALVRQLIYLHGPSPYRVLLDRAGCEYGDLERLVRQEGVEGALHTLMRSGVYLTVDEFKGRAPVIRGRTELAVDPGRFRNPRSGSHVLAGTSASRSQGTAVPIDLAFVRDCAADTLLALDARGGAGAVKAHWQVPGGGALARLVEYSSFGAPAARWFSQVDPAAPALHPRYRWSARVMRWASVLAGLPLPRPQHVPLDDPGPIVRWMTDVRRAGARPHLFSFTNSVVRLCRAAAESGVDLTGALFTVVGEPVTDARLALIRRSGADVAPRYAIIECSVVGQGCLAPEAADDVHLLSDLHALVQPGPDASAPGLSARTLLLSSLRPTAPFVLLNVSMGDEARIGARSCGCPLERLGWGTHLQHIGSREKLTAGGMTFLDADVIRVLEEVLPARFGGGPTDYQLLEDEDSGGRPRLRLVAHPAVGPLDERALVDAFLRALGRGDGAEAVMALMWRDAGFLQVERRPPYATPTGKILHLHVGRNGGGTPGGRDLERAVAGGPGDR